MKEGYREEEEKFESCFQWREAGRNIVTLELSKSTLANLVYSNRSNLAAHQATNHSTGFQTDHYSYVWSHFGMHENVLQISYKWTDNILNEVFLLFTSTGFRWRFGGNCWLSWWADVYSPVKFGVVCCRGYGPTQMFCDGWKKKFQIAFLHY